MVPKQQRIVWQFDDGHKSDLNGSHNQKRPTEKEWKKEEKNDKMANEWKALPFRSHHHHMSFQFQYPSHLNPLFERELFFFSRFSSHFQFHHILMKVQNNSLLNPIQIETMAK